MQESTHRQPLLAKCTTVSRLFQHHLKLLAAMGFPYSFVLLAQPTQGPPLRDIPSGCCSLTGPWTVTRSSLRMLRRVAAFCRPLRPVLLLVSFPRSRSPVVGVLGLC